MSRTVAFVIIAIFVVMMVGLAVLSLGGLAVYKFAFRGQLGSGRIVTETREVSGFDGVSVCCGMQLLLEQSGSENVQLEGDDNILERIETSVKGDTLVIKYDISTGNVRPSRRVQVRVSMPEVRRVETSGGAQVSTSGFTTDRFDLSLGGGSSADIGTIAADSASVLLSSGSSAGIESLVADSLELSVSSGGRAEIVSGEVDDQTVKLTAGSSYDAGGLISQTAAVDVAAGSTATVWVTESLDVNAGGGSTVRLYGTPRITQDTSGGSRIESMGER